MLDWNEGQPYSNRFGDVYFSRDSGLEEKRHVFLQGNRLADRFKALPEGRAFAIGETGFGTGLNFLCACQLFLRQAPTGCTLDFFSLELFPLEAEELSAALALWPEWDGLDKALLTHWYRRVPGWNRWHFADGRIRLTLVLSDVRTALKGLPDGCMDAWFLDGFSPSKNPDMWSAEVFTELARCARGQATLATYTSAGWVRRGLEEAGFRVERVPGYGRKREMSCGRIEKPDGAVESPRHAIVIGGGVAGCATAHALARRGMRVELIEQADTLASGASGNPRGILHARFGAGMNPLHRLILAAYGHALCQLDELVPADGSRRGECGLMQLACNEQESKRIDRLAQLEWPAHLMQVVDASRASELLGLDTQQGGLWFPAGGWVVPSAYCERLVEHPNIRLQLNTHVSGLIRTGTGWLAKGQEHGQDWEHNADLIVVCNSYQARYLEPFEGFPLTPVRGQVSLLAATQESRHLHGIVCGDGYCAPADAEPYHICGATHGFDDTSVELRENDHGENLDRLAGYAPALARALGEQSIQDLTGRASVRSSAPGAMPFIGKVRDGLYCSLAHGTRGLLTAGIGAELIGSQVCGTLPPLPTDIVKQLSPVHRIKPPPR
jgi:tRNA 5-methylaminomethyl-2-thiouridine biosynthesis bifunctional protein